MTISIQMTEEELTQLHMLLVQDIESSRVELHHTAGRSYREFIKQRLETETALLEKMENILPSLKPVTVVR